MPPSSPYHLFRIQSHIASGSPFAFLRQTHNKQFSLAQVFFPWVEEKLSGINCSGGVLGRERTEGKNRSQQLPQGCSQPPSTQLPQGEAGKGLRGARASGGRVQPCSPPAQELQLGALCLSFCLSCSFVNRLQHSHRYNTNRIKPRRLSCSFLSVAGEKNFSAKPIIILLSFSYIFSYSFFFPF